MVKPPSHLSPAEARARIRRGEWTGPTAALAPGFLHANLVIVPDNVAGDFLEFCRRNPAPCPLLEALPTGRFAPAPEWARDADLRTDLPRYRIYREGDLEAETTDVLSAVTVRMSAFLLGCSFSFDHALLRAGIPVRHIEQERNVSMYVTNIPCVPAGPFAGPMVVSMRPIPQTMVDRAVDLTRRIPLAHGDPAHVGHPGAIGIRDLAAPDFGEAVELQPGDIPVFWACGVTPQAVARAARLPHMITHSPGCMFITDRPAAEFEAPDGH